MKKTVSFIEVNQKIGTFYIGKITSGELFKISKVETRESGNGVQRTESKKRINEIASYCDDPDAVFPTPIILAVKSEDFVLTSVLNEEERKRSDSDENVCFTCKDLFLITYDNENKSALVIDGQHRLRGIERAGINDMELPVVLMFDLTEEEKAYVFSTINSNQTKVPKSLIFDLFDLSEKPSPYKTCHEIARILNSKKDSPFYGKLKMLGRKNGENSVLSQGSFVYYLSSLISDNPQGDMIAFKEGRRPAPNPKFPFREFFLAERDDIILKILEMFFGAVKNVFPEEWDDSRYILSKTTGYAAMILVLKEYYSRAIESGELSREFFEKLLIKGKNELYEREQKLTSDWFPSNAQTQRRLASYFINEYEQ